MRVATLMKYVLDPEILSRDFALDFATGLPTTTFPSFQFDRYDRIALEIALNFRNSTGGAEVVSVCTGPDAAQDRLRETLAVKADNALLIETCCRSTTTNARRFLLPGLKARTFPSFCVGG